jgi:hypothetical protein
MKIKFLLPATIIGLITSCAPKLAVVKTQAKANEIIITPELKIFSKTNSNPSVVLRVPDPTSDVTKTEQKEVFKKNDNIYNLIEKNLLKQGFTVRDRGLLNKVLKSELNSYADIGKQIETDIIIDILSIDFAINNYTNTATLKTDGKEIKIDNVTILKNGKEIGSRMPLNPKIAKIECKLTVVQKGATGGILTLYKTTCTDGCDIYIKPSWSTISGDINNPQRQYVNTWAWTNDATTEELESTVEYFSRLIGNALKGQ